MILISTIIYNPKESMLIYPNGELTLTPTENKLLRKLLVHSGDVVSSTDLTEALFTRDTLKNRRMMQVYICKLRRFFEVDDNIMIVNSSGFGYSLVVVRDRPLVFEQIDELLKKAADENHEEDDQQADKTA